MESAVLCTMRDHVLVVCYNRPNRFNAWSDEVLQALKRALDGAADRSDIKAVIVTGMGKYYCSGVDFAGQLRPTWPSTLKRIAEEGNYELFDTFLSFPKPIIAAVNGPAIGAAVTSATLCDAIIASESATFHTPFKQLGITPEGCSSVNFSSMMGDEGVKTMLEEGRKVDAQEALRIGLVTEVVKRSVEPDDLEQVMSSALLQRALQLAEEWIMHSVPRKFSEGQVSELQEVNRQESKQLAAAFTQPAFLQAQYNFAKTKKKTGPMWVLWTMMKLQPLLSRL